MAAPGLTRVHTAEQQLEWFGTSRVRAGYLITPNLLFYGSGGFASGSMEVAVANTAVGVPCGVAGACPRGRDDTFRYGWAAGVGAEYQWGNWSLSLDYIHYDLGRHNFAYNDGISPDFLIASTQFSGDMVRGAINYRFDWTPWTCWWAAGRSGLLVTTNSERRFPLSISLLSGKIPCSVVQEFRATS